ncbi:MAG: HlyD family efflux transporter periplasmic adaptor subunit [Planctomycetaceae bacterium]
MATIEGRSESAVGARTESAVRLYRRRRSPLRFVFLIAVLGLAVWVLAGLFGAPVSFPGFKSWVGQADDSSGALVFTVVPQRLLITVTEDGNVESANNVDVKCEVAGGSTILWIIEDGKLVKKGDEIVRLDRSTIEDQLNAQKIVYNKARAAMIQAKEDFEAAEIGVREYAEGMYKKELQILESQITIAMENLRSAQSVLEHSQKMTRKGFATPLQLEADEFAVQRAKLDLAAAETAKTVLVDFTSKKTIKGLEAARDAAKARMESEKAAFDLEESRMKKLEQQLDKCIILAPQTGMVVYANEAGRRGNTEVQVEEGAPVREGQAMVRLPDLSQMQVKVKVHESRVDQLRPGMPANIKILDQQLTGEVKQIANQPESTGWMSANIKEYATTVSIDGKHSSLKPGMTAAVEILIADLPSVLVAPVSAVVEQRGKFYAWVQTPTGPERRPLLIGMTNDKLIEVKDGLKKDEQVLLNPRAVVSEARVEDEKDEKEDGDQPSGDNRQFSKRGTPEAGSEGDKKASPGATDSPKGEGKKGGGEKGKSGKRQGSFNLMQFDADKDGKISRDEAPEQMKANFDMMDPNKDGFIDAKEVAEIRKRFGGAGGGQGKQKADPGGAIQE